MNDKIKVYGWIITVFLVVIFAIYILFTTPQQQSFHTLKEEVSSEAAPCEKLVGLEREECLSQLAWSLSPQSLDKALMVCSRILLEQKKKNCIFTIIKNKPNRMELCLRFLNKGECYAEFASSLEECKSLKSLFFKDLCLERVAKKLLAKNPDAKLCDDITSPMRKASCLTFAASKLASKDLNAAEQICLSLPLMYVENCMLQMVKENPKLENISSLCPKLNKENKIICEAITSNDPKICEKLNDSQMIDYCKSCVGA